MSHRAFAPSETGYRKMRSHEEQQIHDAFIDGFLSGGNADRLADAEMAWTAENSTGISIPAPFEPYDGCAADLRVVLDGGADDQAALNAAIKRLKSATARA